MSLPWEELRRVDRAAVFKKRVRAAELRREPHGVELVYDDAYLAAGGASLASTLPLRREPFVTAAGALPPYLSGLLPEGRRLSALRTAVKTSADELSLLLAVGADAVGDVQVVPAGVEPEEVSPRVEFTRWRDVSFTEVFAAETGSEPDRVALPGVQPKASARMISLPVRRGSGRFILKLDPPEYPHLCRNEWLMLQAADASGLPVVTAELVTDRDGHEALAVSRFDRTAEGGLLAVEDGCQVAGRYPADKYNLSTEAVGAALSSLGDAPLVVARTLLRWVAFGYVSCNGDLHAKNLAVAERPDGTMPLTVADKSRENIGRAYLMALASGWGLQTRAAEKVLDEVVSRADLWVERLDESGFPQRVVTKWRRAVDYRRKRLAS